MQVNIHTYRKNVSDLANLRYQVASLELLKEDTARLKQLVKFKDQAFIALKKQTDFNREMVDTLTKIKDQQKGIITSQEQLLQLKEVKIQQLEKQKYTLFEKILLGVAAGAVGYLAGKF